jgi:hypothetical protein
MMEMIGSEDDLVSKSGLIRKVWIPSVSLLMLPLVLSKSEALASCEMDCGEVPITIS